MKKPQKILKQIKDEARGMSKEFKERVVTLILGGFGLVTALAWNEAIKTLFENFFPKKSELIGKFVYAAIVTIVVVLLSLQLKKFQKFSENKKD